MHVYTVIRVMLLLQPFLSFALSVLMQNIFLLSSCHVCVFVRRAEVLCRRHSLIRDCKLTLQKGFSRLVENVSPQASAVWN